MHTSTTEAQTLARQIAPGELKRLCRTNAWYHAGAIAGDWAVIFGMAYLTISYPSWWLYIIAVFVIGARMHALAILMHDATHYRFLKNRKWNDRLTNLLCMYPVFSSLSKYRPNHLQHHQHLNTEDDPDWMAKLTKRAFTFPKSRREFLATVSSYLLLYQGAMDAYWFLKRFNIASAAEAPAPDDKWLRPLFYLVLFTVLTLTGGWTYFLLLWVVPYFTTFFMYQYIRSVAEHFGDLAYENELNSTRTVRPNLLERFLIAPHHVGYHLEHHLFPAVPFYKLPELHRILLAQTDYGKQAHITSGYTLGLLNELGNTRREAVVA